MSRLFSPEFVVGRISDGEKFSLSHAPIKNNQLTTFRCPTLLDNLRHFSSLLMLELRTSFAISAVSIVSSPPVLGNLVFCQSNLPIAASP